MNNVLVVVYITVENLIVGQINTLTLHLRNLSLQDKEKYYEITCRMGKTEWCPADLAG